MILVLRDEDKWAASVTRHLQVEREQFKEMMWWRLHGGIYRWIFNHSSRAMSLYMDWFRPLMVGPESRNFYGENMDVIRMKYRFAIFVKIPAVNARSISFILSSFWQRSEAI